VELEGKGECGNYLLTLLVGGIGVGDLRREKGIVEICIDSRKFGRIGAVA